MKQDVNTYLFSNFENSFSKSPTKNSLTINKIENLTTQNKLIEPLNSFSMLIEEIVSNENIDYFVLNNKSLLNNIVQMFSYKYHDETTQNICQRYFAIDKENKLFELNQTELIFENCYIYFSDFPTHFYRDGCLYFFSKDLCVFVENENAPIILNSTANIQDLCFSDDYLMFTTSEKYVAFFTQNKPLYNIESNLFNCNSIELEPEFGEVLKIVYVNEKFYIFQSYKIIKVTIKKDEPTISTIINFSEPILKNTIFTHNDSVIFATKSNVCNFDGNSISYDFKNVLKGFDASFYKAILCNEHYYLILNQNDLLDFDLNEKNVNCFKLNNLKNLFSFEVKPCIVRFDGNKHSLLTPSNKEDPSLLKRVIFNKITFNTNTSKIIKELLIIGSGECDVKFASNAEEIIIHAHANKKVQNISISGDIFSITLESSSNFVVECLFVKTLENRGLYE